MRNGPLALICAVPFEASALRQALEEPVRSETAGKEITRGRLDGRPVTLAASGMGKVNAAHLLTALAEGGDLTGVIGFGIGGAYPGSGLEPGELLLADEAVYGDEGVETPEGWLDTEGMSIPLVTYAGSTRYNRFSLDGARVSAARVAIEAAGMRVRTGRTLTVSTCSGTAARGRVLAERYAPDVEEMESAALAHVCALYSLPLLLVRGVSNHIEDRDTATWKTEAAAAAAQAAVHVLVRTWVSD